MLIMVLLTLAVLLLIERIVLARRQRQKAVQVNAVLTLAAVELERQSLGASEPGNEFTPRSCARRKENDFSSFKYKEVMDV